ncbi:MAG: hypothetical protein PVJ67_06560 [Candidatus Pacearchaeota archaeon]|jgi:hypothetical protein
MVKSKNSKKSLKDNYFIKQFLSQKLSVRITLSISVLFFVFAGLMSAYLIFLVSSFSLKSIYSSYLEPLGFDYSSPLGYFSIFFSLEFLGFWIYYLFKRKINWYLFSVLAIILFLLIFGLSFITSSYKVDLPSSQYWKIVNNSETNMLVNCNFSRLDCTSVRDKQYFVDGDEVYCSFGLSKECDASLMNITEVKKIYLNSEKEPRINLSIVENHANFEIKIEKGLKALWVIPYYSTNEKIISPFNIYWEFENIYSEEEYNKRQAEKSSFLIALISLSIFSSIIAMNNLKQLIKD